MAYRGKEPQLSCVGTATETPVTWSVSGNTAAGTSVTSDGLLTVDSNEKAASLTVTAGAANTEKP